MMRSKTCSVVFMFLVSMMVHCVVVVAASLNKKHSLRQSPIQDRNLADSETCLANLNTVAQGSNEVTALEFLAFLSLQSGGLMEFTNFQDVPLDLRLLFYATACSGGRDCTKDAPKISLNGQGMASTLLQIFCTQVDEIVQQPPDSLKVSFSYSLYYKNNLTTQEIMTRVDGNTIVPSLETATERVVSMALGCPVDSARLLEKSQHDILYVHPMYNDQSHHLVSLLTEKEQEYCSRQPERQLQDCGYTVQATVDDLVPIGE